MIAQRAQNGGALPAWRRDWHQFRLLSRDAVRQLIDTALFSRESNPMEFAIWMLALIATPPAFFAAAQIYVYTALAHAPLPLAIEISLAHRLFFVTYGMLASALLAALTWEAIFPDGRDQEVVGVLPVRPQTFAAARLWAAITVGAGFAVAVNVPAAAVFTMVSASHPMFRNVPAHFVAQVVATLLASLTVFFVLLTVRGVAAIALGVRAGAWLGAAIQLVTVILLVEVFFFLPGVLASFVKAMLSGDPGAAMFPPVWFASIHAWLTGNPGPILGQAAWNGAAAFALAASLTAPVYLLPARWIGRRALERRSRERASGTTFVVNTVATLTMAPPAVRAIFAFAMGSLLRSRRHLLIVATYLGMAIAVCVISLLALKIRGAAVRPEPASWVLALPLVFLFFLTLGLRSTFRIPTELEANWPFRLSQPSIACCVHACLLVMFTLAVLPAAGITIIITAPVWAPLDVIKSIVMQLLAGVALAEWVLLGWSKVPFACGHAPSSQAIKAQWPLYLVALYLYAFKLSDWQLVALRSTWQLAGYIAACAIVIVAARMLRWRRLRHQSLEFDAAQGSLVERLNLSGALN